ncbi:protein kinase C-binding protein NELL2-like isoform X2 [Montipora foliosa]|uniref:protein kinase C-binding protein NELL2-like isoform X2 n=1 Tax=Montipora foliosa TaxID=591990 RepID=UPI0035F1626B
MGPVFYLYAVFLLFGLKVFSTCPYGDCRELAFPEFFFFADKRLVNHFIKTLQVNDFDMCQLRCYQNPNCVSINFNFNQESKGNHNCELNNATHKSYKDELDANTGYAYHGTLNACDEPRCKNGGTCQSGFTDKGYRCMCPLGFTLAHCGQDIDECSTGNHNCSHVAMCNNTFGAYNCNCKKGYAADGRNCSDIDECSTGKHNCSHVAACNNTIGSYNCICKEGYLGDGRNCSDIDECSTGEHNCSHVAVCNNTIGSYNCTCQEGYVGDGRNCSDIDECLTGKHNCSHVNMMCKNTVGSYNCTCKEAYVGDGRDCSGKRRDCPKDWVANDKYCYKRLAHRPKKLQVARDQCKKKLALADLPIIKSEQENTFIAGLMTLTPPAPWVRLGIKREEGELRWFGGISAEKTNKKRYNAWANDEPKAGYHCAYIKFSGSPNVSKWYGGPCDYDVGKAPFLLCQKPRF